MVSAPGFMLGAMSTEEQVLAFSNLHSAEEGQQPDCTPVKHKSM